MKTHSRGAWFIMNERIRQVEEEGYTPDHDKGHEQDLIDAAGCYITVVKFWTFGPFKVPRFPTMGWPWKDSDWKPGNSRIELLVKIGALCAAAIDAILAKEPEEAGK